MDFWGRARCCDTRSRRPQPRGHYRSSDPEARSHTWLSLRLVKRSNQFESTLKFP
ncbi:BZ3500_MvSof-1268-A1-R1_Chr12-2g03699 [Microbotryum saponariae]|uniref:BZ3500_MvSof-1268-A1-R1_Chr12-2g03699 protein n=1 Tax=Microbotryum saponariae TaxID=289078 RepID=A0A2X0KRB9_9BASI|nr:BZ3500_MvSof-1268-A1-R1_Chr12-2g03699 [Microbotryum saponariae]